MNILKIFLTSTLFVSSSSFAMSCAIPMYTVHSTTNLYPNSVFWFENYSIDTQPQTLFLKSKNDQIQLIPQNNQNSSNIYMLKPSKKLTVNENYSLDLSNAYILEGIDNTKNYQISNPHNNTPIKWLDFPKIHQIKYVEDDGYGGNGSLIFNYKINIPKDDYLIKVQYSTHHRWKEFREIIVYPKIDENNQTQFQLGFDGCRGPTELRFRPKQKLYMKFDIIRDNGEIIKWQDDPISYKLVTEKEHLLDYLTKLNEPLFYLVELFQSLMSKFIQIFNKES
ncbi:hypothetical protein G9F32_02110 [Acinetobacter sp. 194]|uniref:hypothetical protein n=1 Tax=Acinetobacter shaoyimingii TaxID=2715164 RepID=UPI00140BD32F|nr:hypothetical protein [Acinetobacter shaoyimingii]NHB56830.1 hypothetical protein [Acinetobacter shaoyimingii]